MFALGTNDNLGLGLGWDLFTDVAMTPTLIGNSISSVSISQISASSGSHTLLLSESRQLYSFGFNTNGTCGLGHVAHVSTPTLVYNAAFSTASISSIATGFYNSLVLGAFFFNISSIDTCQPADSFTILEETPRGLTGLKIGTLLLRIRIN